MENEEYEYKNLLVPVRHPDDVNRVTELASVILDKGRVTFLTVIEEGNFFEMQKDWRVSSETIEEHRKRIRNKKVRIVPKINYNDTICKGVLEQAEKEDSDLILIGWSKKVNFRSLRKTPLEEIFANSDRDVIAFRNLSESVYDIKKILFPVGYKDYDYGKRLTITSRILKKTGAKCDLVHVREEDETEEDIEEMFRAPKEFMQEMGTDCETRVVEHESVSEALIEESKNYDLIVLGPTGEYVFSRYLFGWMTDEIVNNAECSALVFKEGEQKWKAWLRGVLGGFRKKVENIFSRNS